MHDFFDILGLPRTAPPSEVRRVCARRVRRAHPDFRLGGPTRGASVDVDPLREPIPASREVAIDFVEMSTFIDGMQAAFFGLRP